MPRNDERRPAEGGGSSSSLARHVQGTTQSRQERVWHAVATVYRVVGTRGRRRSVIVVPDCPWCRQPHVHTGKADFLAGKRTASCHAGRYMVLTGVLEGEVAA